jgi:hypothetical protein
MEAHAEICRAIDSYQEKVVSLLQPSTLSCSDILDKNCGGLGEGVEDIPALFAGG